jgi:glycosyltransferase involved in cell wall biosynthesis
MVQAFSQVANVLPEARLLLVGHFMPPELIEEVKADLKAHGILDVVRITGRVPFETIGDYLKQAAVGWVPWQPYVKNDLNIPTKLFEYMAYAVPIVSSDLRSTRPFVINDQNGYRVPAGDPKTHAQAIIRLLQNPVQARQMGHTGQRWVSERFNWDTEERKLLALYKLIL